MKFSNHEVYVKVALKYARLHFDIDMESAGARIGFGRKIMEDLESLGDWGAHPTWERVCKLAEAYDIDVSYFALPEGVNESNGVYGSVDVRACIKSFVLRVHGFKFDEPHYTLFLPNADVVTLPFTSGRVNTFYVKCPFCTSIVDAGEKGAILGNCKVFWRDSSGQTSGYAAQGTGKPAQATQTAAVAGGGGDPWDEDIPFAPYMHGEY